MLNFLRQATSSTPTAGTPKAVTQKARTPATPNTSDVVITGASQNKFSLEAAPAQAPKRARRSASSAARAGPSERSIPPLEKGKLEGRSVLIPREQWPEEPCDELGGEGWLGKVASERFGTVGVTTESIGVDGAIHNFTYHFVLEEVLRWKPLK